MIKISKRSNNYLITVDRQRLTDLFNENIINKEQTNIDIFLDSLVSNLSQKDKEFIIHIINGLKTYNN